LPKSLIGSVAISNRLLNAFSALVFVPLSSSVDDPPARFGVNFCRYDKH
jgi:hypothetical protein